MVDRKAALTTLVVAVVASAPVLAQDKLPDRRTARGGAPIVSSTGSDPALTRHMLDLLQQVESLQTELRELRNAVEIQGHDLEQVKSRQKILYEDVDKRLREAEKRPAAIVPDTASAAPAPSPAPAAGGAAAAITTEEQKEYDAAFALMKQGMYSRAVKAFRQFLAKHPASGLADNAQYWVAEGNYVLRNYKLALEEFTKVAKDHQSPKVPDAMLKIGYAHYELGAYDKARKALTEVQTRYPGTSVARLATTRLEKMKKEGR